MEKVDSNNEEKNVKIESINISVKENNPNQINYININKSPYESTFNNNSNKDIRSEESIDRDLKYIDEKFQVPLNLKKTFFCSFILFMIGTTLIIIGFIEDIATMDPGKGITFWCLGGILLIPGGYYSYQFYKAKKTKDMQEREDILSEIPEL